MKKDMQQTKSTSKDVVVVDPIVPMEDKNILPIVDKNSKDGTFENFDSFDVAIKEFEEETCILTLGVTKSLVGL